MKNNYFNINDFKKTVKVGDIFYATIDDAGIEYDYELPYLQKFEIIELYPNCVLAVHEHKTYKGIYVHKYCPNYSKLFLLMKKYRKNTNKVNKINRVYKISNAS